MTTLMGLKHRVGAWGACTPLNPSGRETGLGGLAVVNATMLWHLLRLVMIIVMSDFVS